MAMSNIKYLLELADESFVIQHKSNLEKSTHIAYSTAIYTDGKYKTSVDSSTGFIEIRDISDANYIIYLDQHQQVVIYIYENIPDILFKNVFDELLEVRNEIIKIKDAKEEFEDSEIEIVSDREWNNEELDRIRSSDSLHQIFLKENGLMNLNEMICDECGSKKFNTPVLCNDNNTIEYQCAKCYTIYRLAPSKYYRLLSKTKFNENIKSKLNIKYIKANIVESDDK